MKTLDQISTEISQCTSCGLCKTRTKVVPGSGNSRADLMLVGEGPGKNEDLSGLPFQGRSGKLLNEILKSVGINRKNVYITNVVKCRPPGNRNPTPEEIDKCWGFLKEQVEIVNPKVVVPMGTFATQTILRARGPISLYRGLGHKTLDNKRIVIPTFHPAYALRKSDAKLLLQADFRRIKEYSESVSKGRICSS